MFYSLQGEGVNSGRAAYFVRLSGCDVGCEWCDSPDAQQGGEPMSVEQILCRINATKAQNVVITGGEPSLYNLGELCGALRGAGKGVWVETSGTNPLEGEFDWVCLSPKAHRDALDECYAVANELKIVVGEPADFEFAEQCAAKVGAEVALFLQAQWQKSAQITPAIVEYIKENPRWRLSVQQHKYINIP